MKFNKEDIDGLLPNLRNLVEPRVEQRLFEAFRRVYEIMLFRFDKQQEEFDKKLREIAELANTNLNNLVGVFPQPLAGSPSADPKLQSIVGSFGSPEENTFLAGPIPTFKPISLADVGLSGIDSGEYLKKSGDNIVGGTPIGTTNLAESVIPTVEGILYTVPPGYRTLFRTLVLDNTSGDALDVNIKVKDGSSAEIYSNMFTVGAGSSISLILNIVMEQNFTIHGSTTAVGAINFAIFGSQEPL